MALPGCGYGSLRAPSGGLDAVEQVGCGSGHQGVGHGLRAAWQASRAFVSLGLGLAIWQPPVSPTALALPHGPKHEPSWKLLG